MIFFFFLEKIILYIAKIPKEKSHISLYYRWKWADGFGILKSDS